MAGPVASCQRVSANVFGQRHTPLDAPACESQEVSLDALHLGDQLVVLLPERFDGAPQLALGALQAAPLGDPARAAHGRVAAVLERPAQVLDQARLLAAQASLSELDVQLAHAHVGQLGLGNPEMEPR